MATVSPPSSPPRLMHHRAAKARLGHTPPPPGRLAGKTAGWQIPADANELKGALPFPTEERAVLTAASSRDVARRALEEVWPRYRDLKRSIAEQQSAMGAAGAGGKGGGSGAAEQKQLQRDQQELAKLEPGIVQAREALRKAQAAVDRAEAALRRRQMAVFSAASTHGAV